MPRHPRRIGWSLLRDLSVPCMSSPESRRAAVLMVQGTASHAGKSTVCAGLCRLFADEGLRVAPFKAQNMSLNAAVTADGGEIGRAQFTQALAARTTPSVLMNPILLKPTDQHRSQVVVLGRATETLAVRDYYARREALWRVVTESLDTLRQRFDVVIIEGAGSPAEINLAQYDLVNMRVARHADAPVLLVGDIERGGVFASFFGTAMLLPEDDRRRIVGYLVNKFRGDPTLLDPGFATLLERTGIRTLGVLPWTEIELPEEDSLGVPVDARVPEAVVDVAVVRLPHLANFDDFSPLAREPGVHVRYVTTPSELTNADLVVIPGTKSTMHDLAWLRERQLDAAIAAHRRAGGAVLGVCGGYQMLGQVLHDPDGVESPTAAMPGLGLLDVETTFAPSKVTRAVRARSGAGAWLGIEPDLPLEGFEIHMGRTVASASPAMQVLDADSADLHDDGAVDADHLTMGTYLHGIFVERAYRRAVLERLAEARGGSLPPAVDACTDPFDAVANLLRTHLDMVPLRRAMGIA
ncbi:MAG: cobQ [Gemmatimonadetes bacterium]|nr:cobQ [Gemmatimonadota bacterium]